MPHTCPFCTISKERAVGETPLTITVRDGSPLTPGHMLILTRRHIGSFFETTDRERQELLEALARAKEVLAQEYAPDGYNIGINDGAAAGQTIEHLHIHLIPRYAGDCDDPRGGIRWIKPEKARYWNDER